MTLFNLFGITRKPTRRKVARVSLVPELDVLEHRVVLSAVVGSADAGDPAVLQGLSTSPVGFGVTIPALEGLSSSPITLQGFATSPVG